MSTWEYTLTGFDDFLEQRRVAFTQPMPRSRVCSICGRVPSGTALLPCGHVFCGECQGEMIDHSECPFDRMPFEEDQLVRLRFELSHLEQLSVVCTVGGKKCGTFSGKLSELKDHMRQCRSVDVECEKCRIAIPSDAAVEHYTQCYTESDRRRLSNNVRVQVFVEEVRRVKEDLQAFRQLSLGEHDAPHDNLVNGANRLMEKLASLERTLSLAPEMAAMTIGEGSNRLLIRQTPGPFRAASKAGLFVTTCQFANMCVTRQGLTQSNKEARVSTDCSTLAGYTFKVDCKFTMSAEEDVDVSFILFLQPGVWDESVEWPFAKKVAIIIAHPTDERKDVRLTSCMEDSKMTKKPSSNTSNWGRWTVKKNWRDIEHQGFLVKGSLYINVEFE
ncbi:hypothetical protein HPB51_028256 [Rhipicephalus microplus]|uniref:RING-type domain-containing protein n=1 Tax=Rhipicephalus microplus TaxID=6941 RepID=A0A9J6CXV0_RHIMP|nr:hypothetical protein HPB51_028256 [Rhipicephalus microplus]